MTPESPTLIGRFLGGVPDLSDGTHVARSGRLVYILSNMSLRGTGNCYPFQEMSSSSGRSSPRTLLCDMIFEGSRQRLTDCQGLDSILLHERHADPSPASANVSINKPTPCHPAAAHVQQGVLGSHLRPVGERARAVKGTAAAAEDGKSHPSRANTVFGSSVWWAGG
ncbi:unnamed protein product [Pleuronectes platessa]|uniref:Uncharacterized protein n=1 Tax=Pleuronectes platessa TaxID=8262 RepID=A0A9N7Z3A2_PLEPL|nr:unnamed protein product [Pleuronectes platessa]